MDNDLRRSTTQVRLATPEGQPQRVHLNGAAALGNRRRTTMTLRTRHGNSVSSRSIPVVPAANNEQLIASISTAGSVFAEVEETGESSDDESDEEVQPEQDRRRSQIRLFPAAEGQSKEQEIEDELAQCERGKDSANLAKAELLTLPSRLETLVHLKEITADDNKLSAIRGATLRPLVNLVNLQLSGNQLQELPIEVFQLPALQKLLLDHNQLTSLPIDAPAGEATMLLPELIKFGAEWNKLQQFPAALIRRCPKLAELYLSENDQLLHLPPPEDLHRSLPLKCKIDNRPSLLAQLAEWQSTARTPTHFAVELNKIYPDLVPVGDLNFLYLGSLRTGQCAEVFRDLNIGYVLTAGRGLQVKLSEGMEQLELGIDDLPGEDMKPFFAQAFDFINKARDSGKGILIHCFAGMSRSVTFTCAYLMHTMHMTRDEALAHVRKYRPAAMPNDGFMRGLAEWESILRAEKEKSGENSPVAR